MSTDHDIGYGWFLKTKDEKKNVEVVNRTLVNRLFSTLYDLLFGNSMCLQVPVKRRKSHIIPESGVHICECPGECMYIYTV